MSFQVFLFYLLAGLTGLCAISVVVTQNIVRAAAWLLFTLAGVSGILFFLGANFVGATQLLVYVGGTLVLVVFGVMLTAQGPFITMKTGAAEWAVSTLVGLLLYGVLATAILTRTKTNDFATGPATQQGGELTRSTVLGESLLGIEQATPKANVTGVPAEKRKDLPSKGERSPVGYLLPFEIVSVHLLVVLIGAAYLARTKRRRQAEGGQPAPRVEGS
ncbi:MAG TPA: NADH-quinone oxidoreductase subunit J [Gemmataceae bacterium]|nr:NADH-quinone oxidoreductase subunit J [Gemmataceae bacterium]